MKHYFSKKVRNLVLIGGSFATVLASGIYLLYHNSQRDERVYLQQVLQVEKQPRSIVEAACDVSNVQNVIDTFVANQAAQGIDFAIAYANPETGCQAHAKSDQEWIAASTTKVVLAMMVYERVAQGTMTLTEAIAYEPERDFESGAGALQAVPELGEVDVASLVYLMITESDNIAKNMLLRVLGGREAMHAYIAEQTGIYSEQPTTNEVSARQLLEMLLTLIDPDTPGSEAIQTMMVQASNETRFAASVSPDGSKPAVAHKIGDYVDNGVFYLHDIGIINTPTPYVLVVFTRSQPENDFDVYEQITALTNELNALHQ